MLVSASAAHARLACALGHAREALCRAPRTPCVLSAAPLSFAVSERRTGRLFVLSEVRHEALKLELLSEVVK